MATLRFDVVSIFPELFGAVTQFGITRRAHEQGLWQLVCWNPREHADNAWRAVDDRPFGGGPGMVMSPAPLAACIKAAQAERKKAGLAGRVIYFSPQGAPLSHAKVCEVAQSGAVLLCGRYEAVDERVVQRYVNEELSIGDFVLSGGEIAALALLDACVRQLPGALNDAESAQQESFVNGLLDCPHYTRPEEFEGMRVPPVLLSGHHDNIRRWRLKMALGRTWQRRPDLMAAYALSSEEAQLLEEYRQEHID